MHIYRTHGAPTGKSATIPRELPFERAEMPRGDGIFRQRALVGNPLDDEQRSDDLSKYIISIRQLVRRSGSREGTNLSLSEERDEDDHIVVPGDPQYDNQQRVDSVKGTRLDEHGDDGLGQSTDSGYPHGGANVPGV